jgi:hypothetical protein
MDARKHLAAAVGDVMSANISTALTSMLNTVAF